MSVALTVLLVLLAWGGRGWSRRRTCRVLPSAEPATVGGERGARLDPAPGRPRRPPGAVLVVGTVALAAVAGIPVALAAVGAVVGARWWRGRRAGRREDRRVADELPDVTDLLALAIDAGLTVHLALGAVARHGDGPLADAFDEVLDRVGRGARLGEELESVRRLGPSVDPLVDALLAAERYGTPLSTALERISADGRAARRRRLEEEARKVPVRLLFPLVCCILPSVGLLTVVPVAGAALDGLSLPTP